jgi:hypothetical protein
MFKFGVMIVCAMALTGCVGEAHSAKLAYINAARAYNACLLANPQAPANCTAQKTVMDNDLNVFNTVSGD